MRTPLVVAGLWCVLAAPLPSQSSWCRYHVGSIKQVTLEGRGGIIDSLRSDQKNTIINTQFAGRRARVQFLNLVRRLGADDSVFLDRYFLKVSPDTAFRALFHSEEAFLEGKDTFWLPTQDSLIFEIAAEAQAGDSATVFTSWLGAHQEGSHVKWMFVVNEFATSKSQAGWNDVLSQCGTQ